MLPSYYSPRRTGVLLAFMVFMLTTSVNAGVFEDGDLIVTESSRILRLNLASGERTIISGDSVGSGANLRRALCLELEPTADPLSPNLLVAEFDGFRITRIDSATGDRETVSSEAVGTGPSFRPSCLTRSPDGTLFASSGDELIAVDPVSGNRTILSSATVGAGPAVVQFGGLQYLNESSILVTDMGQDAIISIDPSSGDRVVVASDAEGTGPSFGVPRALAIDPSGFLLVADSDLDAVVRTNPIFGDRKILSSEGTGMGAPIDFPHGITVDYEGDVIVANFFESTIIRIHAESFDRSTVTSAGTGTGPAISNPRDVDVVQIGRRLHGFELEPSGGVVDVPALQSVGTHSIEFLPSFFIAGDDVEAAEGSQVLYMSTGPGAVGDGSSTSDSTGNGESEFDNSAIVVAIHRLPNDPSALILEYDILTGESPTSAFNDGIEIEIDGMPIVQKVVQAPNGNWEVEDQFDGSGRTGADGSNFVEGRVGFRSAAINLDYGTHLLRMRVFDEADTAGDTALLVDNIRFAPEPTSSLLLAFGVLGMLGLHRTRVA